MATTTEEAKAAADTLALHLRHHADVQSVGLGEKDGAPALYVYLTRRRPHQAIPAEWKGLPVLTEVIGKVRPA